MPHTPGPWTIGVENEFYDAHTSIDAPKWGGFCQVVTKMDMESDSEEGKANAILIAAAPDLLEALKELRMDLWLHVEPKHGPKAAKEYPSIVAADAAIARATGKSA